jgi:hypothetical protein
VPLELSHQPFGFYFYLFILLVGLGFELMLVSQVLYHFSPVFLMGIVEMGSYYLPGAGFEP